MPRVRSPAPVQAALGAALTTSSSELRVRLSVRAAVVSLLQVSVIHTASPVEHASHMAAQPQFVHPEHRSFVDLSGHNLANPHPFAGSTVGRSPDLREALGGHPSPLPAGSPAPAQNSCLRPLRPLVPVAQGARALPDVLALGPDLEPVPCFCSPCPVPQGSGGACGVCGGGQGLAAPGSGSVATAPSVCLSLQSSPARRPS